ncbi:MAG: hypothetical protein KBD29_00195 [Candidatus Magasanikbacteria bacterium]|nr:hypothetical protein [Candidatus Magasanikbacteria bacterium]
MKKIPQEALLGCAIACTASRVGLSYKTMKRYFDNAKYKEKSGGFYNRDIVKALDKLGVNTTVLSMRRYGKKYFKTGTIVFVGYSAQFPAGHFLLKTKKGWMDSWINYLELPIRAGYRKKLPGTPEWIILIS